MAHNIDNLIKKLILNVLENVKSFIKPLKLSLYRSRFCQKLGFICISLHTNSHGDPTYFRPVQAMISIFDMFLYQKIVLFSAFFGSDFAYFVIFRCFRWFLPPQTSRNEYEKPGDQSFSFKFRVVFNGSIFYIRLWHKI